MLLLQIVNGKKAGVEFIARRLPVRVGRSPSTDLVLEEPGVWDDHFQIVFSPEGLILKTHPQALVMVNDQTVSEIRLRNGDLISIGPLKLRFGFAPVRQGNQKLVEWLTWIGLAALCFGQVALIYWLMGR
jgi:pSer/pThr/pTyr-binding forkhead associated (FHA) protein